MPATPLDSATYRALFGDAEVGRLFTDAAEIRAMLLVEGALAKAQGETGSIPETAAYAIHRASLQVSIGPEQLAEGVGQSAVPVPALVSAFRAQLPPEHAAYVHWGATSQDIIDTALVLRLRQAMAIIERRLVILARSLADIAEAHADAPHGGAHLWPSRRPDLVRRRCRELGRAARHAYRAAGPTCAPAPPRQPLRRRRYEFGAGRAGGPTRAALGGGAGPRDRGGSWHTDRGAMAEFAGWLTLVTGTLGKLGQDLTIMTRSGSATVRLGASGGSSTMPQKSNPVLPSLLVAIARQVAALNGAMQGALIHAEQRDAAAWIVEWLSLPQMVLLTGRALTAAGEAVGGLEPDAAAMQRAIRADGGVAFAEALAFALADTMPRPKAQKAVAGLCRQALDTGTPLADLAAEAYPDADLAAVFHAGSALGTGPARGARLCPRGACAVRRRLNRRAQDSSGARRAGIASCAR